MDPATRALRALPDADVEIERVVFPQVLVFELDAALDAVQDGEIVAYYSSSDASKSRASELMQ
ncbi:MAG: hypothetical protein ACRDKJ_10170 [Actinomycetota bacterium]